MDTVIKEHETIIKEQDNIIDELIQTNKDLTKIQEELSKENYRIQKADYYLQGEGLENAESIINRFREELNGYELGQAIIDGKPNLVYSEIMSLNELFEETGLINGNQANALNNLAGQLVDYAYKETGGDDTPWSDRVIGIADDIRDLASKHDVNNDPLNDGVDKFQENYNRILDLANTKNENGKKINDATLIINDSQKIISEYENLKKDYTNEKKRTQSKINELK